MHKVCFLTAILTHYRLPFHEGVRARLATGEVNYRVVYGRPEGAAEAKKDTATLPWGRQIENRSLRLAGKELIWQPALAELFDADLVVLGQENKHLINYLMQSLPRRFRPRVALFGHGRNFQTRHPDGLEERWKRFWATRADWWFAYTDESRRHIESLGFPAERITVCNNAIDTSELRLLSKAVTPERLAARRAELGLQGDNICIFVGALYPDKRLDFLIQAAELVRGWVSDFELIVVGSGVSAEGLLQAAATRPWLKVAGPRFGVDKVELMLLAKLFLIPGALGLAVLDAATLGLPLVTTDYPYHGPEIAYLENGKTGLVTAPYTDAATYARAISELLQGPSEKLASMSAAARAVSETYSIETMARRFAEGALRALRV